MSITISRPVLPPVLPRLESTTGSRFSTPASADPRMQQLSDRLRNSAAEYRPHNPDYLADLTFQSQTP